MLSWPVILRAGIIHYNSRAGKMEMEDRREEVPRAEQVHLTFIPPVIK